MDQIDKVQTTNTNESVVNGEVVITALRQRNVNIPTQISMGGMGADNTARTKINEVIDSLNDLVEKLKNVGIISRF